MSQIQVAYEILSEARRSRDAFAIDNREFTKIKAHMYSIFECYAHGIINWKTVEKFLHKSLVEYCNLYRNDKKLFNEEKAHMLDEYVRLNEEYKPALDEYRKLHETRLTSNLVIKKQISESTAQQQSNFYYNNRALKESELKDIATLKTWNRVMEAYPNLTKNDEVRVRMLTIMEGPTLNTTQLITTVMDEGAPTTSLRPVRRPASNIGSTEIAPNGQVTGSTRGVETPGFEFNPRAGHRDQPGHPENRGLTNRPTAPTTSTRPKARPDNLNQRNAINRAVSNAMGESNETKYRVTAKSLDDNSTFKGGLKSKAAADAEAEKLRKAKSKRGGKSFDNVKVVAEGYKVLPNIDRDRYGERAGLEGPFQTMAGKVVYYDPKEGAYYDPDTDRYMSYDEFKALDKDYSGMSEEMNDDEVNAFHTALDSLVHQHLGHSSDEVDEAKTKPGHNMRAQQRLRSIMDKAIAASKAKRGIDDEDEDIDRTDETMSGSIGTIAMPMGKMRKRNKDTIFASKEEK